MASKTMTRPMLKADVVKLVRFDLTPKLLYILLSYDLITIIGYNKHDEAQ